MESSKKFRLKRLYKTTTRLGWSCLIFFVLFLVGTLIIRSNTEGEWGTTIAVLIAIGLLGSLMTAMIMTFISAGYQRELLQYKHDIKVYRSRKFAAKTMEYLQEGEIQKAIDEYIKCKNYPEKSLDDYLYGMLISACYLSKDEKLMKGAVKFVELKERYSSDKIILD